MKKSDSTEKKILDSAIEVFSEKGYHGARMREIAERAGVNKALLNYYFRSKEKLFHTVFTIIFEPAMRNFVKILDQDGDIFETLEKFIRQHQRFLRENPEFPLILAKELSSRNPEVLALINTLFARIFAGAQVHKKFFKKIKKAIEQKIIRPVEPHQLIINILSMNILVYVAEPLFNKIFNDEVGNWNDFMVRHEEEVVKMVIQSLLPIASRSREVENE